MDRYRREDVPGAYAALAVYECPLSLIERSIELASGFVTVENFRPARDPGEWIGLSLQLYPDDAARTHRVRSAVLDLAMTREEFRRHLPFWDVHGVYAVFTRRGPLGFRATDLGEPARYRALRNYDWTLEQAIPGPSGGEWGRISSPDPAVIQQLQDAAEVCDRDEGRQAARTDA
jgi:hypothetical protein